MAKRETGATRKNDSTATTGGSEATAAAALEQRVVAFAEQLGRIAGSVQAKAEGWMDRETLNRQIAGIRDGAADLLQQLGTGAAKGETTPPAATPRGASKGRSGGIVDAPGKKHRKPLPSNPDANLAHSQAAKMQAARTMVKTRQTRGRG